MFVLLVIYCYLFFLIDFNCRVSHFVFRVRYDVESGSLLKAVMGPVEV